MNEEQLRLARRKLWWDAQIRHRGRLEMRFKSERAWFWKSLNWLVGKLLWLISLGKIRNWDYLLSSVTTIGHTIWVPDHWDRLSQVSRLGLMAHEIDHIDFCYYRDSSLQDKKAQEPLPFGIAQIWNALTFSVGYILSPSFRAEVEKRGYKRNAEAYAFLYGPESTEVQILGMQLVAILSGNMYGRILSKEEAEAWWASVKKHLKENEDAIRRKFSA